LFYFFFNIFFFYFNLFSFKLLLLLLLFFSSSSFLSLFKHGLLASGGGTADRKILFWNTLTGNCIQGIDTGSQVCNLSWSKTTNELVSTHGYSQNQIIIWKYPSLHQIATLIGHTYRVLYLAMSPDGQNIVTGAGDETLRFWNVFNKSKSKETQNGALSSFGHIR